MECNLLVLDFVGFVGYRHAYGELVLLYEGFDSTEVVQFLSSSGGFGSGLRLSDVEMKFGLGSVSEGWDVDAGLHWYVAARVDASGMDAGVYRELLGLLGSCSLMYGERESFNLGKLKCLLDLGVVVDDFKYRPVKICSSYFTFWDEPAMDGTQSAKCIDIYGDFSCNYIYGVSRSDVDFAVDEDRTYARAEHLNKVSSLGGIAMDTVLLDSVFGALFELGV